MLNINYDGIWQRFFVGDGNQIFFLGGGKLWREWGLYEYPEALAEYGIGTRMAMFHPRTIQPLIVVVSQIETGLEREILTELSAIHLFNNPFYSVTGLTGANYQFLSVNMGDYPKAEVSENVLRMLLNRGKIVFAENDNRICRLVRGGILPSTLRHNNKNRFMEFLAKTGFSYPETKIFDSLSSGLIDYLLKSKNSVLTFLKLLERGIIDYTYVKGENWRKGLLAKTAVGAGGNTLEMAQAVLNIQDERDFRSFLENLLRRKRKGVSEEFQLQRLIDLAQPGAFLADRYFSPCLVLRCFPGGYQLGHVVGQCFADDGQAGKAYVGAYWSRKAEAKFIGDFGKGMIDQYARAKMVDGVIGHDGTDFILDSQGNYVCVGDPGNRIGGSEPMGYARRALEAAGHTVDQVFFNMYLELSAPTKQLMVALRDTYWKFRYRPDIASGLVLVPSLHQETVEGGSENRCFQALFFNPKRHFGFDDFLKLL